jgi:hypothetical protein
MDCSALVKLDPENEGLWTGHTTFNAYWCMLRVFKVSTGRKAEAIASESEPTGFSPCSLSCTYSTMKCQQRAWRLRPSRSALVRPTFIPRCVRIKNSLTLRLRPLAAQNERWLSQVTFVLFFPPFFKDDFFLLSRGMTVVETSLTVFNKSLYRALSPASVPVWVRSQVANRLAGSSEGWARVRVRQPWSWRIVQM